jgi:glycine/D-amino acid oxidase-like deaminating enzyme/nitrite reductase/ring-hydroxylating ferredoxin subunit
MDTYAVPAYPALRDDVRAEVCVLGSGIAGMSAAYELAREGRAVVVLDAGPLCGGETARTTAHVTSALDDQYVTLARIHGAEEAALLAESHRAAVDRIAAISAAEGIDCDLERLDGYLVLAPGDSPESLERERDAARRAGLAVELVPRAPVEAFPRGPALRYGGQAQLHPLRYVAGLARAVVAAGGRIFTDTRAVGLDGTHPLTVTTERGPTVTADHVIVATNSPISERVHLHVRQTSCRTYVVAGACPRGAFPRILLWDTADPYHYVRSHPAPAPAHGAPADVLIVGGEDHVVGHEEHPEQRWERLEAWARERFPFVPAWTWRWSGEVQEPHDHIGFIGPSPGGPATVHVITGDSGDGITHGVVGALVVADRIAGRPNPWATLYQPDRRVRGGLGELASHNLSVAWHYTEWLRGGEVRSYDEIPRGSGAVVRRGLRKLAVFRDDDGTVTERSASCTHLRCVVHWNAAERSWDCPCHGSRYDAFGRVLNGPATADLARVGEEPSEVGGGGGR